MESDALRPEPQYLAEVLRRGTAAGAHPLAVLGFPSYAIEAAPAGVVPFLVATLSTEMRDRFTVFPNRPDAYALDLAPEALDPTFAEAMRTPGVKKELTPEVARGAFYVTAGWSLVSFVKSSSGVAADYVARWKEDPATAPVVREELRRLLSNDAFRRSPSPQP